MLGRQHLPGTPTLILNTSIMPFYQLLSTVKQIMKTGTALIIGVRTFDQQAAVRTNITELANQIID